MTSQAPASPAARSASPASPRLPLLAPTLLATAVLGLHAPLLPAQDAAAASPSASAARIQRWNLPAGPLADVLGAFAARAGLFVAADGALTQGRTSPGVSGDMTAAEALSRLLTGTGTEAVPGTDGSYTLRAVPSAGDAQLLAPVRVTGDLQRETASGPVGGYVARQSATGSKTDTPLIETPQTVNVVTREEIAARGGARTVMEALAYTPGFRNPNNVDTRYDYGLLRGFSAYQSMYADGLSLPYGLDRASPQMEPYGLERVEVLKGPSSVLYGQNPPGGLINAVSKRPTAERRGEVLLQFATHEQKEAGLDLSGPLDERQRWQYRLVAFGRDGEEQVDFVDDRRVFVAPSLRWAPGEDTELTVLTHWQQDRGAEFNNTLPNVGTQIPGEFGRIRSAATPASPTTATTATSTRSATSSATASTRRSRSSRTRATRSWKSPTTT